MATERQLLLSPDVVARAAAMVAPGPEQRWMLRQNRAVRRSFVERVLDDPDPEAAQQVWMLHQPRAVRQSYVDEVLAADPAADPQEMWMLRQPDEVCRSYARDVLLAQRTAA